MTEVLHPYEHLVLIFSNANVKNQTHCQGQLEKKDWAKEIDLNALETALKWQMGAPVCRTWNGRSVERETNKNLYKDALI